MPTSQVAASCRHALRHGAIKLALLAAVLWSPSGTAGAQSLDPATCVTDGSVNAIAISSGRAYIGGMFSYVGPPTGCFVGMDTTSGDAVGMATRRRHC